MRQLRYVRCFNGSRTLPLSVCRLADVRVQIGMCVFVDSAHFEVRHKETALQLLKFSVIGGSGGAGSPHFPNIRDGADKSATDEASFLIGPTPPHVTGARCLRYYIFR